MDLPRIGGMSCAVLHDCLNPFRYKAHLDFVISANTAAREFQPNLMTMTSLSSADVLSPRTPKFRYEALSQTAKSIRLIQVLSPRSSSGRVRLHLKAVDLDNAPVFEALSYTWGTEKGRKEILVDNARFKVRRNLHDFLVAFSTRDKPDGEENLWIDQISINQSDVVERSAQVQIMGRIYSQAEQVICWLGTSSGDEVHAMKHWRTYQHAKTAKAMRQKTHTLNAKVMKGMQDVQMKEYWSRLWIIQELVLARSISLMCGDDIVSWKEVNACQLAEAESRYNVTQNHIVRAVGGYRQRKHALSLLSALQSFISQRCADPRDLIYGLLSITDDTATILIDYSKNNETGLVDAASHLLPVYLTGHKSVDFKLIRSAYLSLNKAKQMSVDLRLGRQGSYHYFNPRLAFHQPMLELIPSIRKSVLSPIDYLKLS